MVLVFLIIYLTCSKVIYDCGGPNNRVSGYIRSTLTIYPDASGKLVTINGLAYFSGWSGLNIYEGETEEKLLNYYVGFVSKIPLFVSSTGPLTIRF